MSVITEALDLQPVAQNPYRQRILVCHNFYQHAGGEDQVFNDECALLRSHGHEVFNYTMHNDDIASMSKLTMAKKTIFNRDSHRAVTEMIVKNRIDLVHCHNTFPLISPSVYWAANEQGVPVVQTLHNFRLLCPSALLLRDGRPCEKCLGKTVAWQGIVHACYRDDRAATTAVAAMLLNHNLRGTWKTRVQAFIALSNFARNKFVAGGLPADKFATSPNFMMGDPGSGDGGGGFALFVGRLSREKGIGTVIDAWRRCNIGLPLKIVGDGPMEKQLRESAHGLTNVEFLGRQPTEQVLSLMGQAACIIMPSVWYENCPKTVLEAYAKGTPVIASRIGALEEMVSDGRTGLHFEAGNADELGRAMARFAALNDVQLVNMRREARIEYENKYTADVHYPELISIYRQAKARSVSGASRRKLPVSSEI